MHNFEEKLILKISLGASPNNCGVKNLDTYIGYPEIRKKFARDLKSALLPISSSLNYPFAGILDLSDGYFKMLSAYEVLGFGFRLVLGDIFVIGFTS